MNAIDQQIPENQFTFTPTPDAKPLALSIYGKNFAVINTDGTCTYDWPGIEEAAAMWKPGAMEIWSGVAKLLLPFRPVN